MGLHPGRWTPPPTTPKLSSGVKSPLAHPLTLTFLPACLHVCGLAFSVVCGEKKMYKAEYKLNSPLRPHNTTIALYDKSETQILYNQLCIEGYKRPYLTTANKVGHPVNLFPTQIKWSRRLLGSVQIHNKVMEAWIKSPQSPLFFHSYYRGGCLAWIQRGHRQFFNWGYQINK